MVRNTTNLGFTVAANAGARAARGEFLLFLNNDAVLEPRVASSGWCSVPALGHGSARSAESSCIPTAAFRRPVRIIWADGSCDASGRGGDPAAPEYSFERPVDFCSGALLLTRRDIFEALGGFDERYRPAYYEDADYCVRLWQSGRSVVYQPNAVATHHEFGSASAGASIELQRERRAIFAARHKEWLSAQCSRTDGLLAARSHPHRQRSVLFIDDDIPDPANGAGFPRSATARCTRAGGARVTMYVTNGDGRRRRWIVFQR